MEIVSSLVSLTVSKFLHFSGLADDRNVLRTKKMEEKALEVYGEPAGCARTGVQGHLSTRLMSRGINPSFHVSRQSSLNWIIGGSLRVSVNGD